VQLFTKIRERVGAPVHSRSQPLRVDDNNCSIVYNPDIILTIIMLKWNVNSEILSYFLEQSNSSPLLGSLSLRSLASKLICNHVNLVQRKFAKRLVGLHPLAAHQVQSTRRG
jgi:hypothetical protein